MSKMTATGHALWQRFQECRKHLNMDDLIAINNEISNQMINIQFMKYVEEIQRIKHAEVKE